MFEYSTEKSKELFFELKKYLVDGVGSSFHKAPVEEYPIVMDYGKGSKIYDVDGNEYIDFLLGFGPMILGYHHEYVSKAVIEQIEKGSHFAAPTQNLYKLSKKITEIIPSAEAVSFQSTGTEANMHAFRVARAYTAKNKIVKFEGQYHGWSDEQKVSISASSLDQLGPYKKPWKILCSDGQNENSGDELIIMPWNDIEVLEDLFIKRGHEIAAVVTEPYMCDEGPIFPKDGFLEKLRELTIKYDILLIFDEIITGFRLALGGAQEYFGVTPDISVFAKGIASGYPISAVCGKNEIMNCGVHPSGTFNANPIGVVAALATLEVLEKGGVYDKFQCLGNMLSDGIKELGKKHGIPLYTRADRAICQVILGVDRPLDSFRDYLKNANANMYNRLVLMSQRYGVRMSFARGRIYLSTAHTEADINRALEVFDQVFSEIK